MTTAIESAIVALLKAAAKKLAAKAQEDQPDVGYWRGKYTLSDFGKRGTSQLYTFKNDATDPLRFCHAESGFEFRPGNSCMTDLGTIPWVFRGMPRKYLRLRPDDFKESYILHDWLCVNGWCWVRKGEGEWKKMAASRKMADVILFWCLSAPTLDDPPKSATRAECQAVYRAVRACHAAGGN